MVDATPDFLTIFGEALAQPTDSDRASYLDRACGNDIDLRQRIDKLLQAHAAAGNFLGGVPPVNGTVEHTPIAERPGTTIGPYKLLQQIGEGGFGVVFEAEQDRPVRRRVALKVIKPGMDTREVIARFEAERQALAMMDHPNIAKVLDAGMVGAASRAAPEAMAHNAAESPARLAGPTGRPYFVMELVQGVPITEYCDQCNLTTRERLELFVTVCQAVQHAHQKGIIHRDIKPTNVLVAIQDGQPSPKIIDFGVAKALNQQLTEHTLVTAFAQIVGTPLYMSPEQAELSPLGVDTRSDIYSLGVLLYELLTGTTPFDKDRLHSASYDELRRIIREEEPPRPSVRLSSLSRSGEPSRTSTGPLLRAGRDGEGEQPSTGNSTLSERRAVDATTIAAHRRTDPRRLVQTVRGELDWIVMKCLEKDRNRRYESAGGLARDIERYLADEPVQACPPSASYRFRKFARRNMAALIALSTAVSLLIFLVVGLAYFNRMIIAERNEKAQALVEKEKALAQAEVERKRAQDNFLRARIAIRDIITRPAMGLGEWQQLPPPLRTRFSEEALKFYEGLIQEDNPNPSLQYEAAIGYCAIGTLHAISDDPAQAENPYRRSVEIMERLAAEFPDIRVYRGHLAWSYYNLGSSLWRQARRRDAQAVVEKAADIYEGLLPGEGHEDFRNQLALCYRKLSEMCRQTGDSRAAIELLRREIALLERLTNEQTLDHSRDQRFAQAHLLLDELLASRVQDQAQETVENESGTNNEPENPQP